MAAPTTTTTTEIAWEAIARVSGAEARKKRGRKGSRQNEECYSPFASPLAVRVLPPSLPSSLLSFSERSSWLKTGRARERGEAAAAAVTEITSQPRTCFSVLTCGEVELRARSENQTRGTRALVIRGRGVEELIFVDFDIGRIFGCEQ